MSERPIDTRPRREIELRIDLEEEAHQARKIVYDAGGTDAQAKAAAKAVQEAVHLDPTNGETLYDVEGSSRPARGPTGRMAVVQRLLDRDRLLDLGPDPAAVVTTVLRTRGYTEGEVAAVMRTSAPSRQKDGRVHYRGRYGGEELIPQAIRQLADEIEKQRSMASIPPEVEREVASRVPCV